MAGLTTTGFEPKTADEIFSEMVTEIKTTFGNDFDLTELSFLGLILGIVSEALSLAWDQLDAIYRSLNPDEAEGLQQDYANALVGVGRLPATKSVVEGVTLTNDTASPCVVVAGSLVRQSSTLVEWETLTEVTIPANDVITVDVRCMLYGAYTASIGSIDTIVNPIAGWDDVNNLASEIIGSEEETDTEYRLRREQSLVIAQGGTCEAVKNRLLNEVDGVTYVSFLENRTDDTDINGLPPHSFEMIVEGGTDQDIADMILLAGGDGIETYGDVTETSNDSNGNPFTVKFSRITQVPIYLIVDLTTDANYPVDGNTQVKNLLVADGSTLERGEDVINWKLDGSFRSVPGITAVPSIKQGTAPTPTLTTNITIASNERATFSVANISIV